MIQLTPLDKTVAGQELIQMGRLEGRLEGRMEGRMEGIEKGEIIGKIHLAQSPKELRAILKKLETELKAW
ncbi:MAG TPA: hypothetical protein DCQ37_24835 [Desulfobacteraceae bacterium]|nr:hypothetical protein [Desulfobacteraceae bacterium]